MLHSQIYVKWYTHSHLYKWVPNATHRKLTVIYTEYHMLHTQYMHTQKNTHARAHNDSSGSNRAQSSTLQHTATYWNSLQPTTTHCNTLLHTLTLCKTLQYTAWHCNSMIRLVGHEESTEQHTATHFNTHCNTLQPTATYCNLLQHTAAHCNPLQYTATHCSTRQHSATHCNTLQHIATHFNDMIQLVGREQTTDWTQLEDTGFLVLCTCMYVCARACMRACVHAYVCISLTKVVSHWTFWSRAKLWWSICTGAQNEKLASVPPSSGRNDTYVYLIFAQQCIHECSGIRIWICVYTNTKCAREYECVPPIYVWLCTTHTHICIYECGGFIHLSTYVVHLCTWESITNANMQMHHTFL